MTTRGATSWSFSSVRRRSAQLRRPRYGVDQAVLRYERDVRPWHPQHVIFGPISKRLHPHDVRVHVHCVPALGLPLLETTVRLLSRGARAPERPRHAPAIHLAARSVTELPLLDYEVGFDPTFVGLSLVSP